MTRLLLITILFSISKQSFSQEVSRKSIPYGIDPLFTSLTNKPKIDSIHISELDSNISKGIFDNDKKADLITVFYNVHGLSDSIIWFVQDTNYFVSEYQFQLYCSLNVDQNIDFKNSKEKIKYELTKKGRQISKVQFFSNYSGTYNDGVLDSKKIEFDINLRLFRLNEQGILEEIIETPEIISFNNERLITQTSNFNLITLLRFKGQETSPMNIKNEENLRGPYLGLSQYRLSLLDPKTLNLKSDNIIGKYINLYVD